MPSDEMVFQACRAWKYFTFFVLEPITWASFFFSNIGCARYREGGGSQYSVHKLPMKSACRDKYQTDKTKTKTVPDILWGCTANNNVTGWFLKMCFSKCLSWDLWLSDIRLDSLQHCCVSSAMLPKTRKILQNATANTDVTTPLLKDEWKSQKKEHEDCENIICWREWQIYASGD